MDGLYHPSPRDLPKDQDQRLGRIIAVSAARVIVLLDGEDADVAFGTSIAIGTMVKVPMANATVYGMVSGLRVPLPSLTSATEELKIVEIDLVGEVVSPGDDETAPFQRGVSVFPVLGDAVYRPSAADLARVYARPNATSVPIGTIHPDRDVPAYLLVDDLLGKHFSIVGTTGSGKSCAVTKMLSAVIDCSPNAHLIVLDVHNEYASAFGDWALTLSPSDGLRLPYWLFNFEELVEVVIGSGPHQAEQKKILGEAILAAREPHFSHHNLDRIGTVDTPVPYRISDVLRHIESTVGTLNRTESVAAHLALQSRLTALQNDARYAFAFASRLTLRDDMADILCQLCRTPVDGKPITILDLSEIPSEVLNVAVSVICRLVFDFALWSDSPVPITIVCEEAHRYAPRDERRGFEPTKRALSRIAKEGRKYGVSLCVVSQRPSDLAPGLLAECNTIFAMRMSNQDDQEIVRTALPEASHRLMDFLPSLRDREAIAIGEGVSMPMRICFGHLPQGRRPRNATASFTESWRSHDRGDAEVAQTVERWRRGTRRLPIQYENQMRAF